MSDRDPRPMEAAGALTAGGLAGAGGLMGARKTARVASRLRTASGVAHATGHVLNAGAAAEGYRAGANIARASRPSERREFRVNGEGVTRVKDLGRSSAAASAGKHLVGGMGLAAAAHGAHEAGDALAGKARTAEKLTRGLHHGGVAAIGLGAAGAGLELAHKKKVQKSFTETAAKVGRKAAASAKSHGVDASPIHLAAQAARKVPEKKQGFLRAHKGAVAAGAAGTAAAGTAVAYHEHRRNQYLGLKKGMDMNVSAFGVEHEVSKADHRAKTVLKPGEGQYRPAFQPTKARRKYVPKHPEHVPKHGLNVKNVVEFPADALTRVKKNDVSAFGVVHEVAKLDPVGLTDALKGVGQNVKRGAAAMKAPKQPPLTGMDKLTGSLKALSAKAKANAMPLAIGGGIGAAGVGTLAALNNNH